MRYVVSSKFGSYCSDDLGPKVVKQTFDLLVLHSPNAYGAMGIVVFAIGCYTLGLIHLLSFLISYVCYYYYSYGDSPPIFSNFWTPLSWQQYFCGAILVASGLLLCCQKFGSCFEFDQTKTLVSLKRRKFTSEITLPLNTIKAIILEKQVVQGGYFPSAFSSYTHGFTGYRISLVTTLGVIVPLTITYSDKLSSKLKTAKAIQDFLQLPPVEVISCPVVKLGK